MTLKGKTKRLAAPRHLGAGSPFKKFETTGFPMDGSCRSSTKKNS